MKTALLVAALASQATVPAQAPTADAVPERQQTPPRPNRLMPNAFSDNEGCTPIVVQVAGEDREYRGTRLNQQPPARLLYAVDRRVNGCREVTIVNERRIGGAAPEAEPPGR